MLAQFAHEWAQRGIVVGILAVDEEDPEIWSPASCSARFRSIRLALGSPAATARTGEIPPSSRCRPPSRTSRTTFRFFGEGWTLEAAAEALADHGATLANGVPVRMALMVDSIQSVTCEASLKANDVSPRELVTANVRALRSVASKYRLIAIATSEMNRGAYRSIETAEQVSDLAAAKESGAIEYSGRVLLALRSARDHGDLIQVRAAKNKHGSAYPRAEAEFYLRLDRASQIIESGREAPEKADVDQQRADKNRPQGGHRRQGPPPDHPGQPRISGLC